MMMTIFVSQLKDQARGNDIQYVYKKDAAYKLVRKHLT